MLLNVTSRVQVRCARPRPERRADALGKAERVGFCWSRAHAGPLAEARPLSCTAGGWS